ncbi:MAG: endonuclease [Clostridiales bacterium]|nr:endonuclease [Clostridiales bacterium]
MKKFLKFIGCILLVIVFAAIGLVAYLSITEFNPEDIEPVEVSVSARRDQPEVGQMLTAISFNTGYAGLDRSEDFFMDGGKSVKPGSKEQVEKNMRAILSALTARDADICLLQEVDVNSDRSYNINQMEFYRHGLSLNAAYAPNYRCDFVPFPWPPIGKVDSGLVTLTGLDVTGATRESLPVPFKWPVRAANLKRCMLVERVPVKDSDKELVIVNFHLEAYDDGEGKVAQTRQLLELIKAEYRNGNYVIAGGDFNQTFSGAEHIGGSWDGMWTPGIFAEDQLPQGLSLAYDGAVPSCRSLDRAYDGDRDNHVFYIIDGFIVTDNIKVNHIETIDLNFVNSDHNPVLLQFTLQ